MMSVHKLGLFSFPDPVNEVSARLVAAGVALLSALTIVLGAPWLTAVIAYGFLARVASGPTLSPLGQLVTRVIVPRLPFAAKPVPGPPKRFAQGIGAALSLTAALLALTSGLSAAVYALLGRADRRRDARVRIRPMPRLQGVRAADAGRRDSPRGVRALRRGIREAAGVSRAPTP